MEASIEGVVTPVDVATLCEWLHVQPADICFAFVYGSRLYGTARPDSDWDVYVILEDYVGPLARPDIPDAGIPEELIEKNIGDATVDVHSVVKHNWQYLIDRNFVPAVSSLSLPSFAVVKPFTSGTFRFELSLMKLKHEVDKFKGAHEEISLRLFRQGKEPKGKKILVHPLRVLEYAMQILAKGSVYDFEAANKYKRELDDTTFGSPEKAREWFYEKVYHLDEAFRVLVNLYKYHSPINCDPLPIDRYKEVPALLPFLAAAEAAAPPLHVIKEEDADPRDIYVREYIRNRCKQTTQEGGLSLDELKLELSVESVALPDPPHQRLRQLSLDPNYAPRQSKAADQCCGEVTNNIDTGLVLDSSDDWRPVSYGFKRFVSAEGAEEHLPLLDWNSVVLTKKLNGVTVNLFRYNGEWLVSTYIGNNLMGRQIEWKARAALLAELARQHEPPASRQHHVDERQVKERANAEIARVFWDVWTKKGYKLPPVDEEKDRPRCYMFVLQFCRETPTPTTVAVVDEQAERIVAVGARELTGAMGEADGPTLTAIAERHGWQHIGQPEFAVLDAAAAKPALADAIRRYNEIGDREQKLAQQTEIFKLVQKECEEQVAPQWLDYEGLVACDGRFKRVTFSSRRYASLEQLDPYLPYNQKQRLFYDLLKNLYDDPLLVRRFCACVPQWAKWLLYVQESLDRFLARIDALWAEVRDIGERKDLARAIAKHTKEQKLFLFSLHKGEHPDAVGYWRSVRDLGPTTKALAAAIFA